MEFGSEFSFEKTEDEINSFCLDIDKLEQVASKTNDGLPCRIRRTTQFAQKTYFLLRADFSGGSSWDVIIPHPHSFTTGEVLSRRRRGLPLPKRNSGNTSDSCAPKVISWEISQSNAAGVPYLFVESISGLSNTSASLIAGYENWDCKNWIQLARETDTARKTRNGEKRSSSSLASMPSSSISSVLADTNSSRRTTQETARTEVSAIIAKPGKSVRFQVEDISHDAAQETMTQETAARRIRLKRFMHCLKLVGREIERRVIGLLMRWGY